MFVTLRRYLARRKYVVGARLARFLAPDIRREVEIVDITELDDGFVGARIRTWNVLYSLRGMGPIPELGEARRVAIADLWKWTGHSWGGPIPDDDSMSGQRG